MGLTKREGFVTLEKAIMDYQSKLSENSALLRSAANACDATMGSDELSRRHIAELEEALKELQTAAQIAEKAIGAVKEAIIDYEDI